VIENFFKTQTEFEAGPALPNLHHNGLTRDELLSLLLQTVL
jgi:hypothetical protein